MKCALLSINLLSILLGSNLFATEVEVLNCNTKIEISGSGTHETKLKIINKDGKPVAKISQGGMTYESLVETSDNSIRVGLSAETIFDDQTLNIGERLIVHALMVQAIPELSKMSKLSFDLKAVRSAKVYVVRRNPDPNDPENEEDIGMTAVIVAKDEAGHDLGSFLGGLLVTQCNN